MEQGDGDWEEVVMVNQQSFPQRLMFEQSLKEVRE